MIMMRQEIVILLILENTGSLGKDQIGRYYRPNLDLIGAVLLLSHQIIQKEYFLDLTIYSSLMTEEIIGR